MYRKRKTENFQNLRFPISHSRPSLKYSALLPAGDASPEGMIRTIIGQFVTGAQRIISLRESVADKFKEWLGKVQEQHRKHQQLQMGEQLLPSRIVCEAEPIVASQHIKVADTKEENKSSFNESQCLYSQKQEKQQHQTHDQNEVHRVKEAHIKRWQQSKRCHQNQFVNLHLNRPADLDDRSQQIQHLLRRKKQLLYQSKCAARMQTQVSRTLSTEVRDRDKKQYCQDDDGELIEMVTKPIKYNKESAPLLKLANIHVLPGQQLASTMNMKKKTMMEMVAARRMKRKGVGDTCVLVQQMFDRETNAGVQDLMEEGWKMQKGVRMTVKQRRVTTIVRLPTLR